MPVMSRVERGFCCGALWRSSSPVITRALHSKQLGRDVLEVGSGSGAVAERLLQANPELAITATDIDPHMTAAAAKRLGRFSRASIRTADATRLPFADMSFDSVISCLMLHHIVDWEPAVAEAARVLRPGGVLVGYDLLRTPLTSAFHRVDGSRCRLVSRREFQDECTRNGLAIHLESRLLGHVMWFAAHKNADHSTDSITRPYLAPTSRPQPPARR
jgi:SAM-dependent methyltransferase